MGLLLLLQVDHITKDERKEFYEIHLKEALSAASTCTVTVGHFRGPLQGDLRGIYYSSYKDSEGDTQ
jgi:hypothetical protein